VRRMSRRYVDALLAHEETEVFLGGLLQSTGFRQRALTVQKRSRAGSTYTLRRKLSLLVHAVTSFSAVPVMSIFYLGMLVFVASLFMAAYLVVRKLFWGDVTLVGWTSLMLSTWFLSGLLMMSMGVLGLYLSRIFMEVKRRPRAIVRAVHRGQHAAG
jgi:putative glycosyltransferase